MKRDSQLFLEDILTSIKKIRKYIKNITKEEFLEDSLVVDGVIRNLEIIGEAARHIPKEEAKKFPSVPWHELCGMRNILIHEYFGIDEEILWEVISTELDEVYTALKKRKNS